MPAQSRPAGSHFPSFMRLPGASSSIGAIRSSAPVLSSTRPMPSLTAATMPPLSRTTTAPTACPTVHDVSEPSAGS